MHADELNEFLVKYYRPSPEKKQKQMNTINHKIEMLDNNYMFYVLLEIFSDIFNEKEFMCIFFLC